MNNNTIIGIDEAGLGPVFGPLVVAGVAVEITKQEILKKIGVKDSKMFSVSGVNARYKRQEILEKANPHIIKTDHVLFSASEIDTNFRKSITMYDLEIKGIAQILNHLYDDSTTEIIVHQIGGLSKLKFLNKLQKQDKTISNMFPIIRYEKSADILYVPVSMASIIAKTTRDFNVEELCNKYHEGYISGYPTPTTAKFFERYYLRHGYLPSDVRFTRKWGPLQKIQSTLEKEKSIYKV